MSSSAHDDDDLEPPRIEEVSDSVYAYIQPDGSWCINNTGFLVGTDGVVSVDASSTERRTVAYLDAIASVTPLPVRTLVNTHSHLDHTNGNWFMRTATIVAHHRCREEMLAAPPFDPVRSPFPGVDWGTFERQVPSLTFSDALTLWVDDLRCEVRHVGGAAHTTNDAIVWIPDRKVLFAGDLVFNGGTPFVVAGSVAGSLRVLDELQGLGAEVVVPGHGDVCGPDIFERVAGYLRFIQRIAADGRAAGLSPLDAAQGTDLGEYAELLDRERIVGNLHRAYAELDGAEPGAPIDVATALAGMVAYNGGRPLRCLA
jgi:cyclase